MVFSTKDRHPWLKDDLRPRIHEYIGGAIRGENGIPFLVGGTADHVHVLAKLHQDKTVAAVLREVKSNSSGWIHREMSMPEFAWQSGYGAVSVSASQTATVYQYIARQEEHHKKLGFQEEFLAFLKAHGVEYDERYIWQ